MTLFGWALARALVAACLVIVPLALAQAAGALAIGACGAYGFAFDFAADPVARNAALRKCEGSCNVVAALSRNCNPTAPIGIDPDDRLRSQECAVPCC